MKTINELWNEAFDRGAIKIDEESCKSVYTLNTWTDDLKAEASELIENGFWVSFGSTCIGHSLAKKVEMDGIDWACEKYGDRIQIAKRDGWGDWYVSLRK